MITGPGNIYVAAAKRLLQGVVGIDGEAGPTEIGIIADHTADPRFIAADLIGQAEHDENAGCLLITTDPALPGKVDEEVARQLATTRHRERVETALQGQAGYVVADDLDAAIAISDAWAPEHLEIQTEDAAKVATRIRTAARSSSARSRRSRWVTTWQALTTCCRPAAPAGTPAACRSTRTCAS